MIIPTQIWRRTNFNGFEETVTKTTYDLDEHLVIYNFNVFDVGYDRWVRLRGNEQWEKDIV